MISCEEYAEIVKCDLKSKVNKNNPPNLVVVQVGNNSASNSYIRGKKKDCENIGIKCSHRKFNDNITESDLINSIEYYCSLPDIDGVIVQLPLPGHIDANNVSNAISTEKDVDGFRRDSDYSCCTPKGIVDWLEYNDVELSGKDIVVIGRSNIVGKPLVNMLIEKGATVTCCNSKTNNIKKYTRDVDIVISAVGKPKCFDWSYFGKDCEIVIDVGINRDESGKLCGDINKCYTSDFLPNTYITPVPGGVGLLTRVSLLKNVVESYERRNKR